MLQTLHEYNGDQPMAELICNYMRDSGSRHMLNALTRKTFGFDFEGWVTGGYFEGDYIPYSFVEDGVMLSNVSANRMKFMQNGVEMNYIQIGTVMTDPDHRKHGLAAQLMKHVINKYENECDGIYLFGNLGATGFYEKLGFNRGNQYRYYLKDEYLNAEKAACRFKPVKECGEEIRIRYLDYVRNSVVQSSFDQINRYGLQMFYTAGMDNVFYAEDIDCFIVMEQEDCTVIRSVICTKRVPIKSILARIDTDNRIRLGFVPHDEEKVLCISEEYDGGEDYRFFFRGEKLESVEKDKLYFPDLSHA